MLSTLITQGLLRRLQKLLHVTDSGINFEDVAVNLKLSVLKPIHATWSVELYNFFTTTKGRVYVLKGSEKAGIEDVFNGKEVLLPFDPYQDIYANN